MIDWKFPVVWVSNMTGSFRTSSEKFLFLDYKLSRILNYVMRCTITFLGGATLLLHHDSVTAMGSSSLLLHRSKTFIFTTTSPDSDRDFKPNIAPLWFSHHIFVSQQKTFHPISHQLFISSTVAFWKQISVSFPPHQHVYFPFALICFN